MKHLFIDTFKSGGEFHKQVNKVELSLYNKSLLFHAIFNFTRILYPIIGLAHWQKAFKDYEKND